MERAGFIQYGKAITVFGCIGIELPVTKNNDRLATLLLCRGNFFLQTGQVFREVRSGIINLHHSAPEPIADHMDRRSCVFLQMLKMGGDVGKRGVWPGVEQLAGGTCCEKVKAKEQDGTEDG